MAEERSAGVVIYRVVAQTVEFLLLQSVRGNNHWSPPKGHVEPGESDIEAALRETSEEAGLDPSLLDFTDFQEIIQYDVQGRPKTVIYWLALLKDPGTEVQISEEHLGYKWGSLEDSCKLVDFPPLIHVFKAADTFLKTQSNVF